MAFQVGRNAVGDGAPPLFLPDIGTFFNQDLSIARDLVAQLREAGVTAVKGEILHRADVCLDDETVERYMSRDGEMVGERYRDLIERKVVPLSAYEKLFAESLGEDLDLVLSVYDLEGATFARDIGAVALKIATSNIVHRPLIEHVAGLGLPMLIDTGKSSIEEIARAVDWARDAGAEHIVVEHSPDGPPNPVENHNLRFMCTLGQVFGTAFGLSDHHAGEEMMLAAVALGAHVIETGVCPDDLRSDHDVGHALPVSQAAAVLTKCNNIYVALGSGIRRLERDRPKYISRMGVIARTDIPAGGVLSLDTVDFAFPAKGIEAEHWELVEGWSARHPLAKGQVVSWADVHLAP